MYKKILLLLALSIEIASPCNFCTRLLRDQDCADCCEGLAGISTVICTSAGIVQLYDFCNHRISHCPDECIKIPLFSAFLCFIATVLIQENKIRQGIPEEEHRKARNHFTNSVRNLYGGNREVRDSAGSKENRPRFYNKFVLEHWREMCQTSHIYRHEIRYYQVDPVTGKHRMNYSSRTLSQSLRYWRKKNMPLAEFLTYLKEKDVFSEQEHKALWSDLIELGQEMGLSSNEFQEIMHIFPGEYQNGDTTFINEFEIALTANEVTTIIHEFEKVLNNNTAASTPTAQDMMQ